MEERRIGVKRRCLAAAAPLLLALLLGACVAPAAAAAPGGQEQLGVAFSKNAYWYKPGDTVQMRVTLHNGTRRSASGVSVRVRVHARNEKRSDLDAGFEGELGRSYRQTESYGPFTVKPGDNPYDLEMELASSRYSNGVYPLTVEILQSGEVSTSVNSVLVVMSFDDSEKLVPLKLSWVFDTLEPPHRNPQGNFTSDALARECDPGGEDPGWYATLLGLLGKWQDIRMGVLLSPMLLEEIGELTGGYVIERGGESREVGSDSRQAVNASNVLTGFSRLAQSARHQLICAPYASPDLETLVSLGWKKDAAQQLSYGRELLEEILDTPLSGSFTCPPGLNANSRVISELQGVLGQFMVLSPRLLERSREGRRLLGDTAPGSPVFISGAGEERRNLALFADARMERLLERVGSSSDPHGVAQSIIAELTNLYLEQPAKLRACAVVSPGSWHPSEDVLEELMRGLSSAPWLSTVTVAESITTVPPDDETPLEIPQPEDGEAGGEYFQLVGDARQKNAGFRRMVFPGNALLEPLERSVMVSQSDVWRLWDRGEEGLRYATFVAATVNGERAKIDMPAAGSITLTSTSAKIPLSVVNGTGYRVKAVLRYSSNGLEFPSGSTQNVVLEPKENLFEVPVEVTVKGRVRFSVELEAGGSTLEELEFSVLTSRFNTFAIVLVASILGLIGLLWAVRRISRRKVGKHKERHPKVAVEGGGEGD